jgi:hypothetical protein
MRQFETLGQYHDCWATVILCAPTDFPEQDWDRPGMTQRDRLDEAFELLRSGSDFADKKLKDSRRIGVFHELLKMSYEAYVAGDGTLGAHALQEAEGLVWTGRASRLKHVVEAERRAFGEVILFKDVVVSPYPYEGSEADLGDVQRQLWRHAAAEIEKLRVEFEPLVRTWAMERGGKIREVNGRSRKAIRQLICDGATDGSLVGAASAELLPCGQLLCIDVEETGKPLISVRQLKQDDSPGKPRFHLDEPRLFGLVSKP